MESVNSSTPVAPQVPPVPKKTPQDFRFGKLIGEGSFSSVYLAKEVKTGEEFAIKVCNKQHIIKERKTELIKREKDVMAILSANRSATAPFFVRLYATFHDVERLYFVMTYARGGELLKYLTKVGSFDIPCCRFYTGELILGLAHLHKLRIVHRDLKPENTLLDHRGHILITDFGSAKIMQPSEQNESTAENHVVTADDTKSNDDDSPPKRGVRSSSFVGSAPYVSPEVLQGKYNIVGPPADLWALGCILYQFVSGLPPFHGATEYLIFQKIMKLEYQFPSGFDADAKDLVEQLLRTVHTERLGAVDTDPYSSLRSHPFFKDFSWENLHLQDAPLIQPYLPSTTTAGTALRSEVPDSLEPGFNPRVMAERALRDDEDFPNLSWSDGHTGTQKSQNQNQVDSDEDDEEEDSICLSSLLLEKGPVSESKEKKTETKVTPFKTKNLFPVNENERKDRLNDQLKNNPWHHVVQGNLILKQGIVSKRKGLFSRRRMLLLTEGPHLYYCEPNRMTVKGQIPWSVTLNPEPKDFRIFFVHTPNRTYYLEDPEGYALEWCKAINEVRHQTYGESPKPRLI